MKKIHSVKIGERMINHFLSNLAVNYQKSSCDLYNAVYFFQEGNCVNKSIYEKLSEAAAQESALSRKVLFMLLNTEQE